MSAVVLQVDRLTVAYGGNTPLPPPALEVHAGAVLGALVAIGARPPAPVNSTAGPSPRLSLLRGRLHPAVPHTYLPHRHSRAASSAMGTPTCPLPPARRRTWDSPRPLRPSTTTPQDASPPKPRPALAPPGHPAGLAGPPPKARGHTHTSRRDGSTRSHSPR